MIPVLVGRALADRVLPTSRAWRTAADIDADSVAAALGVDPGAAATLEVIEVDHGTSQRSRLVLRHGDGAAISLFAKNTPITFGPGLLDGFAKLCEREASFYRYIAPGIASAPRALISEWEPRTGRSTVVLPDLEDAGFEFRPSAEPCTPEQVGLAIDVLADLHTSPSTCSAGSKAKDPIFVLDSPSGKRLNRFVVRRLGKPPRSLVGLVPDDVLKQSSILSTHARAYSEVASSFPQAFIHNDTHRGNIGFAEDRAVFVDWQGCGWGPAIKDVAYLMSTSLEPEVRQANEKQLLNRYLDRVTASGGTAMDAQDAWFAYRVLAITGYVAAAVTSMFGGRLQAVANAEECIRRASTAVQDLESFAALRQQIENPRRFT